MLAMDVNDDAGSLTPSGVLESIASMLAPTGGAQKLINRRQKPGENASFNFTLVDRRDHPHIGATDA
jgi:hypothetical protein